MMRSQMPQYQDTHWILLLGLYSGKYDRHYFQVEILHVLNGLCSILMILLVLKYYSQTHDPSPCHLPLVTTLGSHLLLIIYQITLLYIIKLFLYGVDLPSSVFISSSLFCCVMLEVTTTLISSTHVANRNIHKASKRKETYLYHPY